MPRIIGGKYKRTNIVVPDKLVRPTSALKREAIFSILESYSIKKSINIYKNRSIIDMYAGSGLIGLEAISRGMKKSYFIENNESVIKNLANNCKKVCKNDEYEIIFSQAIEGLDRKFEIKPSVIFIDPPYFKEDIDSVLVKILEIKPKLQEIMIIIETSKKSILTIPKKLSLFKEKVYGNTKLIFLN